MQLDTLQEFAEIFVGFDLHTHFLPLVLYLVRVHQVVAVEVGELVTTLLTIILVEHPHGILDIAGLLARRPEVRLVIIYSALFHFLYAVHKLLFLYPLLNIYQLDRRDAASCLSNSHVPNDHFKPIPHHCLPLCLDI